MENDLATEYQISYLISLFWDTNLEPKENLEDLTRKEASDLICELLDIRSEMF